MPRNGSGTYSLPEAPFVSGTVIASAPVNNDFNDIATALTGSLAADGQTPATGNLNMNGNSIAGLTALTVAGPLSIGGALTGATSITGSGNLVIGANFQVVAASGNVASNGSGTFATGVNSGGAGVFNTTLAVTGAATFSSTAKVTGATTLSSTLAVTGAATFSSTGAFTSTVTAANGTSGSQVVNYGQFPQTAGSFTGLPGVVGSGVGHYLMTGSGTTDGGGLATITFPNSGFPTACSFFHAEPTGNAAGSAVVAMLRTTPSKTSVDISTLLGGGTGGAAANKTFIWYAFGY